MTMMKKKKKKTKVIKKFRRVYTKQIRVISSGCSHRRTSRAYWGGTSDCHDCGAVSVLVWVRPEARDKYYK